MKYFSDKELLFSNEIQRSRERRKIRLYTQKTTNNRKLKCLQMPSFLQSQITTNEIINEMFSIVNLHIDKIQLQNKLNTIFSQSIFLADCVQQLQSPSHDQISRIIEVEKQPQQSIQDVLFTNAQKMKRKKQKITISIQSPSIKIQQVIKPLKGIKNIENIEKQNTQQSCRNAMDFCIPLRRKLYFNDMVQQKDDQKNNNKSKIKSNYQRVNTTNLRQRRLNRDLRSDAQIISIQKSENLKELKQKIKNKDYNYDYTGEPLFITAGLGTSSHQNHPEIIKLNCNMQKINKKDVLKTLFQKSYLTKRNQKAQLDFQAKTLNRFSQMSSVERNKQNAFAEMYFQTTRSKIKQGVKLAKLKKQKGK